MAGILAGGCRSGREDGSPFSRNPNQPVEVQVDNHNFLNVTIYAAAGGVDHRLGDVTGKSTGRFSINPRQVSMVGGLRLRVDPIGSARIFTSETVFPDRGATVVLTVAADLDFSYITLR